MVTRVTCNASNDCNVSNSVTFADKNEHLFQVSDTISLVSDKRHLWVTLKKIHAAFNIVVSELWRAQSVANLAHLNTLGQI